MERIRPGTAGAPSTVYTALCQTPLGQMTMASDGDALTGLWFRDQRHFGSTLGAAPERRELPVFGETRRWLEVYFQGGRSLPPPLRLRGSDFQRLIWELLLDIPYGRWVSYGALAREAARRLGRENMSPRAVGGAVGRNPVSLIVPCHRVLGASGRIGGYAGGLERKRRLLALEGANTTPQGQHTALWAPPAPR